jgi:TIR domain
MPIGPFLSHKREDAPQLEHLWAELALRGPAGWQDVRNLQLGHGWRRAFRKAIGRDTDGFIWWGTKRSLESRTITKEEIPRALRRTRSRLRRPYPVVPLFVDLSPSRDHKLLEEAFGKRRARALTAQHGAIKDPKETIEEFAQRAARQYVRDLIRVQSRREVLRIAISGGRQPNTGPELSLDWRPLLDDGYLADDDSLAVLRDTLADIRDAAHETATLPRIEVELHMRLPLAALVGWEWNRARPVSLEVWQSSPAARFLTGERPEVPVELPAPEVTELDGDGPAILAVSTIKSLRGALQRYAQQQEARRIVHLHLPGDTQELINRSEIACASDWAARELAALNDEGLDKHMILLTPVSLAAWIGAKAHGTGKTWIPFWDGEDGYRSGVEIG